MSCEKCTFNGYLCEPSAKPKVKCVQNFEEQFSVEFLPDESIEWGEYEEREIHLPGKRQFDFKIFQKNTGPVVLFLKRFQKQLLAFAPHKFYHHHQNTEMKKLTNPKIYRLPKSWVPSFFDYSENPKKLTGSAFIIFILYFLNKWSSNDE